MVVSQKETRWQERLVLLILKVIGKSVKEFILKTLQKDKMLTNKPTEVKGVNLLIIRDAFTDISTIGKLFINGESFCDTLENPYINNERSISCIPEGQYKVRLRLARESATRDYLHLLVQDVPNRSYILFH